jgi:small subunit ribosomal protein S5
MRPRQQRTPSEFTEKIIQVNRTSKKTKGGNQISFGVLVVVGDKKGRVGVAQGKGKDVLSSIKKAIRRAKKNLITVPQKGSTIPFRIREKYGAAVVLLKPAPRGTGIVAGGAVREVVDAAGIQDVVGKILGSPNQSNNAYATFNALQTITRMCTVKGLDFKRIPAKEKPAPSTPAPKSAPPKIQPKPHTPNTSITKAAKPASAAKPALQPKTAPAKTKSNAISQANKTK